MSALPLRSGTGCLTCKCRRKKCDETKPTCLRCKKSGLDCPGYIYIQNKNKRTKRLRTLPAPREKKAKEPSQDADKASIDPVTTDQSAPILSQGETSPIESSNNLLDLTSVPNLMDSFGNSNLWKQTDLAHLGNENTFDDCSFVSRADQQPWVWPTNTGASSLPNASSSSMTSGQASLIDALFSLADTDNSNAALLSHTSSSHSTLSTWTSPNTEHEEFSSDDEDPEGACRMICRPLALDKNVESNALPFVLQNYAPWVHRMAFEPLKVASVVRNFVAKQFEASQESRWTLTLLANIGGRLGGGAIFGDTDLSMISTLQTQMRRQLADVKSIGDDKIPRNLSVRTLDATLETIVVHLFTSPACEWLTLMREAAPVFRQLCSEPPGLPINLPGLLRQPDVCLRHYAQLDILCATVMDIPMLFRYDCTPQNVQHVCESVMEIQGDSGAHWLHGTPDRFVAMFAKINAMREDGWMPTPEIVAVFERGIQEFQPIYSHSCDSFLSATRILVQECWRQVAYIYLYMGLCGDSSNVPRVRRAFKQFMKLVNSTKPGHMPDEFLIMNFILSAPAAEKQRDREVIRRRMQGLKVNGPIHGADDCANIIESYWADADTEGRPVLWSDISKARIRVLGMQNPPLVRLLD
ncbi:hypothetical protein RSOLAG1IB_09985 [Rhizoctonia solani AG-1 IB]|uniref:Zn(2)-C6 fungal-type domain-containing protein n=1 Tax=Thanatephorus cucumeris (strain AG1-IB / isolate 7/3/14) TaxID=1108050 RepID=A0A0B7FYV8_THACB|nr:hypothetical protein RSOLAG1IB_09985 [Rhizoctonia solani AG-1 IB]